MKIIELEAENLKRLRVARVCPGDEPLVIVKGRNGQGKSSLLDAIAYTIGGERLIPDRPVRDGEDDASVRIDLGDLTVERHWTKGGEHSYLTVRDADGVKQGSPQKILDQLYGKISFDPLSFTRLDRKKQVEVLREAVGLDFGDLDQQRQEAYEERTGVNRDLKMIENRLREIPAIPDDTPDEEVSAQDLLDKIESLQQLQVQRDALKDVRSKIKQTEELLSQLQTDEETITQRGRTLAEKLGNPKDTSKAIVDLRGQAGKVDKINAAVRAKRDQAAAREARKKKDKEAKALTKKIDEAEQEKKKRIAAADLPAGVSFDEDGVLLNGVPFEQASSAEQIRASVAVGLAQHPKLRVLLVREGSLLDDDSMNVLQQIAEENDAQVWVERVGGNGRPGVLIEDGVVAEVHAGAPQSESEDEFDL